jgi:hypothetical protein
MHVLPAPKCARMAKVKGAHVINAVKVLRGHRERALAILPPPLHRYLDERILPSSWYPFEEHIELLRAIAAVLGGGAPWVLMGRGTARMDLSGIYKGYLKSGDVPRTLQAMSAMWKSAHDTGDLSVTVVDQSHATARLRGFAPRSLEICGIATGYLIESVYMAINRDPKVTHPECRVRGSAECAWSVDWTG